ncbi:MAG: T9SS type A sorting domain-containing protein [Bacteroidales bacterium]|nr:T9SS type A sorting domain-containing protein [Bacteroidales bacterium]
MKKHLKKLSLTLVLSLLIPVFSQAQTSLTVRFTDGTSQNYVIPTSGGIYFDGDSIMHLQTVSGQVSHRVDEVRGVVFPNSNSISDATIETGQIVLYPNPSKDYITIDGGDEGIQQITVFSANGVAVIQGAFRKGEKIDVSSLKRGMYIVKINGNALKMYKL